MKNIVGSIATRENYFKRDFLLDSIYRILSAGNNMYISGPRRIGKTSLMHYLKDNPHEGWEFIYLNTEAIDSANTYFKFITEKLIDTDTLQNIKHKFIRSGEKLVDTFNKIKSVGVLGVKLELDETKNEQMLKANEGLKKLISEVQTDGKRIVIMVDEFPETVRNIFNSQGASDAQKFLQLNREIRQLSQNNFQFIYSGSTSLFSLSSELSVSNSINDLMSFNVPPFTVKEARSLINKVTAFEEMELAEPVIDEILERVGFLSPFLIQVVISELVFFSKMENRSVEQSDLSKIFETIINQNGNIYFNYWVERIRNSKHTEHSKFIMGLLNTVAKNGSIEYEAIYDLAEEHKMTDSYKLVVKNLEHDKYIVIQKYNGKDVAFFSSPFLREWWKIYS